MVCNYSILGSIIHCLEKRYLLCNYSISVRYLQCIHGVVYPELAGCQQGMAPLNLNSRSLIKDKAMIILADEALYTT